eukprot:1450418-Prymnesium_polylepis.1
MATLGATGRTLRRAGGTMAMVVMTPQIVAGLRTCAHKRQAGKRARAAAMIMPCVHTAHR